jgi:hypothetical protein
MLAVAQWQVTRDIEPGRDVQWLQAVGADVVVVHQRESDEIFQEFAAPRKFAGRLDVLYEDGRGDTIYRVPRRFAAHARIVDRKKVEGLRPIPFSDNDRAELASYVDVVENGPDRLVEMQWEGVQAIRLRALFRQGESLLVQETYDPDWRAYLGGRRLAIRRDAVGFLLVDVPPGEHDLRLVFR